MSSIPVHGDEESISAISNSCEDGDGIISIRVKTNVGVWTVGDVTSTTTIHDIMTKLRDEHKASFVREFTKDVAGDKKLPYRMTVGEAQLKDNDIIFTQVKLW